MSTRNLVGLFYFWKMLCDKVYPLNYAGMGNLLMFVKVAGSWLKYRPENHCRVLLPPEKNPQVYKCKYHNTQFEFKQHTNTNAKNPQVYKCKCQKTQCKFRQHTNTSANNGNADANKRITIGKQLKLKKYFGP